MKHMKKWQDWDGAAYELGLALGVFNKETHPHMRDLKGVFWSRNPVGEALHRCLEELVKAGVLLGRGDSDDPEDDGLQRTAYTEFKWNPAFRGSWQDPLAPLQEFTQEVFAEE